MPSTEVSVDHDEFQDLLDRAQELEDSGGDYSVEGLDGEVDPEVLAALRDEEDEEKTKSGEVKEALTAARNTGRELSDTASNAARNVSETVVEPNGGSNPLGNLASAAGQVLTGAGMYTPTATTGHAPMIPGGLVGGASQTGPYDHQAEVAQMQQPGLRDYSSIPPTAQNTTQYDYYQVPQSNEVSEQEREELIQSIVDYAESDYSDEEVADNGEYTAGGGSVVSNGGESSDVAAVKDLAQEIVDMNQDYAWGGGHGAEPGPSQGTLAGDQGGAALHGDDQKVGMDCSGLARYFIFELTGEDIGPGATGDQIASGEPVEESDLRPGDLVFPHDGHVQVYIGDGQVVEAQKSGTQYMISDYEPNPTYIRRFADVSE